eukprot:TRINITY_DN22528_c0_g1_i1.p2 TRINITY_DN22528_c0_g1~~TRINITY_DN22528_c0_g1_i1.p2  ORF type:complete len:383 (+),score=115.68 TRINITY_DN22528_c0_g1_i1:109-1257(+)
MGEESAGRQGLFTMSLSGRGSMSASTTPSGRGQSMTALSRSGMSNNVAGLDSSFAQQIREEKGDAPSTLGASQRSEKTSEDRRRTICNDRFQLLQKLGAGAFGQVYIALDKTVGSTLAIKIEKSMPGQMSQLSTEYRVYKLLERTRPPGVPIVHYAGTERSYNILALDLLGPCLADLMTYCRPQFSEKTVLMLGMQMIQLLQNVHEIGYLHRDLKPENFTMGIGGRANHVYLIDFGLARKYLDKAGAHIPFKTGKGFTGTARYASLASHKGNEQGRKDDFESLMYVLAFFANGQLPWQGSAILDRAARKKHIQEQKTVLGLGEILGCLPQCFHKAMHIFKDMPFEGRPDYSAIYEAAEDEFNARGYQKDFRYDWFDHVKTYQ